jgi:hypothetical protein
MWANTKRLIILRYARRRLFPVSRSPVPCCTRTTPADVDNNNYYIRVLPPARLSSWSLLLIRTASCVRIIPFGCGGFRRLDNASEGPR